MKVKTLLVATLLMLSGIILSNIVKPAYAEDNNQIFSVSVKSKPSFTKEGYILRLKTTGPVYVGRSNYRKLLKEVKLGKKAKTLSAQGVKRVKFRIEKVLDVKGRGAGAPLYLVSSKNNKYSIWVTQSELQYYYLNSKAMQGVTNPLKRIAKRLNSNLNKANNKYDFQLAQKSARKLSGKQKSFVLRSLKQLKKDGSMNVQGTNLLIFGL